MPAARWIVWGAAGAAVLARAPGALWPLRPDEAGFLLVARSWEAQPDSMFGTYWVDRPPTIIALVGLADRIGGDYFLRLVAAIGCGLLVLAAAATARRLVVYAGSPRGVHPERVSAATAVVTAALVGTALVDPVSAKGELLGIPLVMGSCWAALVALERRSGRWAFLAGLLAVAAAGMKQNMVGGLVFGGVLLVGALVARRITGGQFGRLALAAAVGALIPVAVTIGWALAAGVELQTMWDAIYGFRSEAIQTITSQPSDAPRERARELARAFVATGMVLVVGWFLLRLSGVLRVAAVPALATLALLAFDLTGLVLGGSFWKAYLVPLVPGLALATALFLVVGPGLRRRTGEVVVGLVAVSTVVSLVGWGLEYAEGQSPTEVRTGQAIARAAEPGDTLVVYGGRADIQWASGLPSPYEHLWSLPMRTNDPDLAGLRAILEGPDAPTWLVEWVDLEAWDADGSRALAPVIAERYEHVADACGDHPVFLLRGAERPELEIECSRAWQHLVWEE